MEARVRFEQQRASLQSEVAQAKARYLKKLGGLERQLDQARGEKRDLQQLIEQQKHQFRVQLT